MNKSLFILIISVILNVCRLPARVQDDFGILSLTDLAQAGNRHLQGGDHTRAKILLNEAAQHYDDDVPLREKQQCVDAMITLGYISYFEDHRYDESYRWLSRAIEIARDNDNMEKCLARAYLNLGNLYQGSMITSSDPYLSELALSFYAKGFEIAEKIGDQQLMVKNFLNLTSLDKLFPHYTEINREIKVIEQSQFADTIVYSRYAKILAQAIRNLQKQKYAEAAAIYENLPQYADDSMNPDYAKAGAMNFAGRIYLLDGKYDKALEIFHKVLATGRSHGLPEVELEGLGRISEILRLQGDSNNADVFRFLYLEKKDSLLRVHQTGAIPQMHYASLFDEESRLRSKIETQLLTTRAISVSVCLLLTLVIVLAYFLIRKNRLLASKNDELYRKNTELLRAEENLQNQKKETPKKNVLTDTVQIDALEAHIEDILNNPEFLFSADASLKSLAEKVSSNTSYVSFILNQKYSENFSILLGNLRVKEICRRVERDPQHYLQLTVEAISAEAGFKSRSTFRTAFIRATGLTPSDYIHRACNQ